VELEALRIGEKPDSMNADEFAALQVTAGFALIMLEREAEARTYFERALVAKPTLRLDPISVSPKFRVVFDEVREAFEQRDLESAPKLSATPQVRNSSRVLNLLLPGVGFIREGNALRGAGWLGLTAASAIWFAASLAENFNAREKYLAATDPAKIRGAYNDYDDAHRQAWTAGILSAGIYLLCQTDLALYRPRSRSEDGAMLTVIPLSNGVRFSLNF
jgi:hypothetical protein